MNRREQVFPSHVTNYDRKSCAAYNSRLGIFDCAAPLPSAINLLLPTRYGSQSTISQIIRHLWRRD